MAIHYVTIKGRIKGGKLEIDLPPNTVEGEIEVQLPVNEQDLTEELLENEFTFKAVPSNQLVLGGWEDMDIEDSVEWVAEMRRKQREERQ